MLRRTLIKAGLAAVSLGIGLKVKLKPKLSRHEWKRLRHAAAYGNLTATKILADIEDHNRRMHETHCGGSYRG